ncbi:MAG: ATP-binding cassette domain-containing protein [Bacteroidota bacterium]|mgnify:CR=1 FL=1|nr:ATP-binding cassette domain-containing protein [Bacteroidota bacterium]MDX5404052.1 ATP-binding cassette domain-containing protein [Bacteroidota bacterium]MDX5428550.1 ATP-binding cassette domain-containing protein [Bacteroidota bacterium]MDX5506309.1 ATP-binding cassette domain-containing protein [Bacteroidota bacterium]
MIRVEGIYKSFGDTEVLKGIDTTFEKGKTNLIIGRSGSGKTVFLKCILGLYQATAGEIFFEDRPISGMTKKEGKELRKEIGMVFQGGALFDSLTVEENVMFALNMFTEMTPEEKLDRVNFCLNRVNLQNVNHLFPAEISGGMQKRVAIARAISMNPKYLFCDEPNSGLDPETSIVIDNLIQEITYEFGMTTVINTHDMNSVLEIGDKVLLIKDGRKAWEGSKNEILHSENQDVVDYVFRSNLFKRLKTALQRDSRQHGS